jgi:hypothetical protein
MENPRFEHLDDIIEDDKGWRRRGDFSSEEDWQNGVNPKQDSPTVTRWKSDSAARAAAATGPVKPSSSGGGSSGGGSSGGTPQPPKS